MNSLKNMTIRLDSDSLTSKDCFFTRFHDMILQNIINTGAIPLDHCLTIQAVEYEGIEKFKKCNKPFYYS